MGEERDFPAKGKIKKYEESRRIEESGEKERIRKIKETRSFYQKVNVYKRAAAKRS